MTPRAVVRRVTPGWALTRARRIRDERRVREFAAGRGVPWSPGYSAVRDAFVGAALDDAELLDAFRRHKPLPPGYGVGIDERCIEYPWVLGRLGLADGRLLDAGSALNHALIIERPEVRSKSVHILTLAPEHEAHWEEGISYLYADLRDIPIRDDYYDLVISISTLEHIGQANDLFTADKRSFEQASGDRLAAVRELYRVLKPGGRFLFTVPFGVRRDYVTFEQLDSESLEELLAAFDGSAGDVAFYRYDKEGWQATGREECATAEYSASAAELWLTGRRPSAPEPDRAAAARAVACIELRKGME